MLKLLVNFSDHIYKYFKWILKVGFANMVIISTPSSKPEEWYRICILYACNHWCKNWFTQLTLWHCLIRLLTKVSHPLSFQLHKQADMQEEKNRIERVLGAICSPDLIQKVLSFSLSVSFYHFSWILCFHLLKNVCRDVMSNIGSV